MNNLNELKVVTKAALLKELIERTKSCALVWIALSPVQFKTTNPPFDFYITRTSTTNYILDVLKNNSAYRNYDSQFFPEVDELYQTISVLDINANIYKRTQKLSEFVGGIRGACDNKVFSNTGLGGIRANSSAIVKKCRPTSAVLNPFYMDFTYSDYPWVGTLDDINENVYFHDGDAGFIRQEVERAEPFTTWGIARLIFDPTILALAGRPVQLKIRTADRRDTPDEIQLRASLYVNSYHFYTRFHNPASNWAVTTTGANVGWPPNPSLDPNITSLAVFLELATYTSDTIHRAVRISACDILATGLVCD